MAHEAVGESVLAPAGPQTIAEEDFYTLMASRAQGLLGVANYVVHRVEGMEGFTRPMLGELVSQSSQLEELLDAYGAGNNRQWFPLRSLVAAIKLFTGVSYVLRHIQHALPNYRLLDIGHNFEADTRHVLSFTAEVLMRACHRLLAKAVRLRLPIPEQTLRARNFAEQLPPGRLPSDRAARDIENAAETVTHLATEFLTLSAASDLLHVARRTRRELYADCVPDPVSEDRLRHLEFRFHNLQSLYDTYVSETQTETLDPDLPILRGHISVILHLVEMATAFVHHYERHVIAGYARVSAHRTPLVDAHPLLSVLMEYCLAYASRYLERATDLCQQMLARYARVDRVTVSAPRYRGFHVRPSTLVAKIVLHYGSDVRMELEGESYDAASPIEIFRANERINAVKRRWLGEQLTGLDLCRCRSTDDIPAAIRGILAILAEQGKVVLYEQPLRLRDPSELDGANLMQALTEEIARLQATGQIDIEVPLEVTFIGDRRVLDDIRVLADNGYGEDNFGNNIALPTELGYLRR